MKFFISLLMAFLLLYATHTSSQFYAIQQESPERGLTNVGLAVFNLTAPDFNCDGYLAAVSDLKILHVAFLYNTFGNDFSCLRQVLDDPRLETIEIALINEPAHRNGRLGKYEFLHGVGTIQKWNTRMKKRDVRLKNKFRKYVKPLQAVLEENLRNTTELFINPGLESNLSDDAGKVLVSWARDLFPQARIVWNPLRASPKRRTKTRADVIEGHGFDPKLKAPCIYNMDGTDVSYPDRPALGEPEYKEGQTKNWLQNGNPTRQLIEEYANKCEVAYIWVQESNGLSYRSKKFIDPRKRDHNISKSVYDRILEDVKFLQNKGKIYPKTFEYTAQDNAIVSSCDVVSSSFEDGEKKGNLLKQSEFRDRGGVLILSSNFKDVDSAYIVRGETIVDSFENTGLYKDGRALFRSFKSPQTYPFKTYLVFNQRNKKICYKLPNPRVRLD